MKKYLISIIIILVSLTFVFSACNATTPDNNSTPAKEDSISTVTVSIAIGSASFEATLYDNDTAKEFAALLPLTMEMSAIAHEKYYNMDTTLTQNATKVNAIQVGDLMLWGSNCFVLFYESFGTSYSYTKIGKINDTSSLADAVGSGSVTITITLK